MPDLPPTTARKPTDPDEPDRTGRYEDSPTPHAFTAADDIQPGTLIAGKYKLLEAIGEGGMGAVWMAQQIEPVKRHVALKLIKSGMDSKTVVARFEAERQALSMMDHPNIARVFDVGTTSTGRPYFVMELVKGTPITDFCDQRKLTPRQRLELFVPVCNAIQHAHQKGIIHRDIKPSNVLVALHDDKPVPKVIDFGVAKATGFTLTEKTLHTGFEQVVGTPAYMSPEQATFNQMDIDTRSDVYSLGVLLYELLTGTTPIEHQRFNKAAFLEMLRLVREEEPPRPSTRLSSTEARASIAAVRGTEPARLSKEFRGELDWIAMKALEKDRSRRYETANGLARDVQRYLADEVVEARPPSMGYRVKKFVRRHKGRVGAASLIVLALISGAIGAAYGVIEADNQRTANSLREQAERDRDAAEKARDGETQARAAEEIARKDAETARDREVRARNILAELMVDQRLSFARGGGPVSNVHTPFIIVCDGRKAYLIDSERVGHAFNKAVERVKLDDENVKRLTSGGRVFVGHEPVSNGDYDIKSMILSSSSVGNGTHRLIPEEIELTRKPTATGETLEQARSPGSALQIRLASLKPDENIIQFNVFPDSYEHFQQVRQMVVDRKFAVAWYPLRKGAPITLGSGKRAQREAQEQPRELAPPPRAKP